MTVAIFLRVPLLFTPPILSDDIYRYLWDGRVQLAGINPYVYPPSAPELSALRTPEHALINHPTLRTVYPPLTQWVYRWGAFFHPTIWMQKIIFTLFDVATIFLLLALLKFKNMPLSRATLYAWNPLVVIEFSGSGHNDSLMIFFLTLACFLYAKGKSSAAAVGFAAATLSKWIPVFMIPWYVVRRDWRFLGLYGLVFAVICLPFVKGVGDMLPSLSPAVSGLHTYARDWVFNPSLYVVVGEFLPHPLHRRIFLGLLLVAFSLWWAFKQINNPLLYILGCLMALLLLGPVVHPWYVTWIVPFLCFYPLWSGLAWSGVVLITYVVLIRYRSEGVWQLPLWVSVVEYSIVYGLLTKDLFRWLSPSSSPR
ncbi:MAG: hypothetical protein KCHDKBKB_02737 [Elusimicrobia bacterium]|nr:hypothetical protein [Elusimicrobiota bacterium]